MKQVLIIAKKELKGYFSSPLAYVVMIVFLILYGFFFFNIFSFFNLESQQAMSSPRFAEDLNINRMVMEPLLQNMGIILLFMIPFLTMRLFAEEKKSHTMELLITSPLHLTEIILGKFLAPLALVGIMLLISCYSGFIIVFVGDADLAPILSGYLGILLLSATYISLGIFTSSLTENQIISACLSFGLLLLFWVIGWASSAGGGFLSDVLNYLSLPEHLDNFLKGILDTRDIIFYLTFSIFGLFLTQRILESQRWR